jgi:hypothetical protein
MLPLLLGAAGAIISPLSRMLLSGKQNRLANKINPVRTYYEDTPGAKANLSLANNMYNGRMAGAANAEANITQNAANAMGDVRRSAASGSQLLAAAAGLGAQADQDNVDLAAKEAENKTNTAGLLFNANKDYTDNVYQDRLMDYQEKVAAKDALTGASLQNKYGAMADIGNGLMSAGNYFMQNGLPGGKRAGTMPQRSYVSSVNPYSPTGH